MAKMGELKATADPSTANEKMVKVKIPLSRNDKEDVFVGLNGRTFLIKRGEEVEVPEGVAEILKHREEVLMQAMEFEDQANRISNL